MMKKCEIGVGKTLGLTKLMSLVVILAIGSASWFPSGHGRVKTSSNVVYVNIH
jgi:hypothetical protein